MARQLRPEEVRQLAEGWGVDPRFVLAIYGQESSSGRNPSTSSKGARGGFQIRPATFQRFNPNGNIDDPLDNANGAIAYMKQLLDQYGDYGEAAEAYFGGAPIRVRGRDYADPSGTRMSQYRDQVIARMGLNSDEPSREWSDSPMDRMRAGPQIGLPPAYLPPSEYVPMLSQLANEALPTPTLEDFATQVPYNDESFVPPSENPLSALVSKMYGAVDPQSGLPMDVALGLRDASNMGAANADTHQYLSNLVDTTLKGMDFG